MESNQNVLHTELIVDQAAASHLKESAGWARFLGIVGILGSVCLILLGVFFKQFLQEYGNMYGSIGSAEANAAFIIGVSVFYGVLGFVLLLASVFHLNFGSKAKRAVAAIDAQSLAASFKSLKGYYRIMGILTILGILLFILGLAGTAIMGR